MHTKNAHKKLGEAIKAAGKWAAEKAGEQADPTVSLDTAGRKRGEMAYGAEGEQVQFAVSDNTDFSQAYSAEYLKRQPDMKVSAMPESMVYMDGKKPKRAEAIKAGIDNVKSKNSPNNTSNRFFVDNVYTGRSIQFTKDSLTPGLTGNSDRQDRNTRAASIIGDILENAIPVNELKPRPGMVRSYVMIGMMQDSEYYYPVRFVVNETSENMGEITGFEALDGVNKQYLYAANAGKGQKNRTGGTKPGGFEDPLITPTDSKISIEDLLGIVKNEFGSSLSKDVLDQFGMGMPEDDFAKDILYSLAPNQFANETIQRLSTFSEETKAVLAGRTHEVVPNAERMDAAWQAVRERGRDTMMDELLDKPVGEWTPQDHVNAALCSVLAEDAGDLNASVKMAMKYDEAGTNAGQTLQACKTIKQMTPSGTVAETIRVANRRNEAKGMRLNDLIRLIG